MVVYAKSKNIKVVAFEAGKQVALAADQLRHGEPTQIKATPDARFVFIGVAAQSCVGVFGLDEATLELRVQRWIRMDFRTFEMDDLCSCIVFMNDKCRALELFAVKWEFDKSQLDAEAFARLNDGLVEQDEEQYNSQFTKSRRAIALAEGGRPKTACCFIF